MITVAWPAKCIAALAAGSAVRARGRPAAAPAPPRGGRAGPRHAPSTGPAAEAAAGRASQTAQLGSPASGSAHTGPRSRRAAAGDWAAAARRCSPPCCVALRSWPALQARCRLHWLHCLFHRLASPVKPSQGKASPARAGPTAPARKPARAIDPTGAEQDCDCGCLTLAAATATATVSPRPRALAPQASRRSRRPHQVAHVLVPVQPGAHRNISSYDQRNSTGVASR